MQTIDGVRDSTHPEDEVKKTWGLAIRYIVGRKRAEEALGLLAAAGTALCSIPDYEAATRTVAQYLVPYLADWCRIDRFGAKGLPGTIACAKATKLPPEMQLAFEQFLDRPDGTRSSRARRVWESCKPLVYPQAHGGSTDRAATNGNGNVAAVPTGIGTAIIVPIEYGGRSIGTLSCATAGVRKTGPYGAADVALLGEIARRVASAVVIAELTRTLAQLQRERPGGGETAGDPCRKGMA